MVLQNKQNLIKKDYLKEQKKVRLMNENQQEKNLVQCYFKSRRVKCL